MADLYYRHDVFRIFPGLGGYAYRAQDYCPDCAQELDFGPGALELAGLQGQREGPAAVYGEQRREGSSCSQCGVSLTAAPTDNELADAS